MGSYLPRGEYCFCSPALRLYEIIFQYFKNPFFLVLEIPIKF